MTRLIWWKVEMERGLSQLERSGGRVQQLLVHNAVLMHQTE